MRIVEHKVNALYAVILTLPYCGDDIVHIGAVDDFVPTATERKRVELLQVVLLDRNDFGDKPHIQLFFRLARVVKPRPHAVDLGKVGIVVIEQFARRIHEKVRHHVLIGADDRQRRRLFPRLNVIGSRIDVNRTEFVAHSECLKVGRPLLEVAKHGFGYTAVERLAVFGATDCRKQRHDGKQRADPKYFCFLHFPFPPFYFA